VQAKLGYLGVRHIRDAIIYQDFKQYVIDRYRILNTYGLRVTGVVPYTTTPANATYKTIDLPQLLTAIRAQRDVLAAVEGPNETDLAGFGFFYKNETFPKGTIAFMKDFYPAIKNDPQLRSLPVVQTSLAHPYFKKNNVLHADLLGDLSPYADYGNNHNYFAFGQTPSDGILGQHLGYTKKVTPGKPMMATEGGYRLDNWDGHKGTWGDGQSAPFDERVHGRYTLRFLLEQYRLGYTRSFLYELRSWSKYLPADWGLFRVDGSVRPAAFGLRSMIKLLAEGRWDNTNKRWIVPTFTPGSLNYSLSGVPASVHSLLLQKSNGRFYLVLWNEVKNWDSVTGKPVFPANISATLTINQSVSQVKTFLPLTNGETATATVSSSTLQLSIPDHPLIVEITPQ
jgi:serralysin